MKNTLFKFKFKLIIIITMSLMFYLPISFQLKAQNTSLKLEKLNDYLIYAEKNNNELQALFYRWKASVSKITKVQGLPDPKLTFSHFLTSVETKVGPQKNKYSLMQIFPWFGKLSLKGKIASSDAKSIEQKLIDLKFKIDYKITKMYSKFYYLFKSIQITKANIKLMNYFESVARTRYKTGQAPHSAIIKAQVEIGKLEDKLITLKTFRATVVEKLNALLNRNRFRKLDWPTIINVKKIKYNFDQLHEKLLFKNPKLKVLSLQKIKYSDSVDLAKKQFFPDFALGMTYVDTGTAIQNVDGSGKDPLAIGITMTLPIWFSKNSAGLSQARSMKKMIVYKTKQTELNLKSDLTMAFFEYNNNKRKLNLYKETLIPKANQSLRVTREAFESGKVNFLSLIDAQRILLNFELQYHKSLADELTSVSKLEFIVGQKL